jgi:uncharacterized membrane protein YkoI
MLREAAADERRELAVVLDDQHAHGDRILSRPDEPRMRAASRQSLRLMCASRRKPTVVAMRNFTKVIAGVASVAALGLGGAAIAGATGGDDDRDDGPDVVVTGAEADRAGAAATRDLGGGTVREVERSDEGGRAAYEVEVDRGGTIYEVQVAEDYSVLSTERDD